MSIRERIEKISDREIAEALLQSDSEENNTLLANTRRIVKAYGINWSKTTTKEDCEIFKEFIERFVRLVAMYGLAEIAEMQQREKVEKLKEAMELEEAMKMQLVLNVAFDIANFFTSFGQTTEIPSERLISFAEKIVERVRNA